jgi:hypothetical protein
VLVNFETHRGRLLYEPNSTAEYLRQMPDLHLVADFSHWTVVTESMLGDYQESLELAQQRTRHIHARVGFSEGPQVPDARLPKWADTVNQFEKWWDVIVSSNPNMTVDPEFGPPDYQWVDANNEPLSDVEAVSLWMKDRLKARWS